MSKKLNKATVFIASSGSVYESDGVALRAIDKERLVAPKHLIAVIPERDFILHSFDVPREIGIDKLPETVEIRMFQDAGLNPMIDYENAFSYRDSRQDGRMYSVTAVAISTGSIESGVAKIKDKVSYIDSILPASSLPCALYNAEILEKKKDVFIYFQKDSLVISIFDNGEMVYGKSQDGGLAKIHETYVATSGVKSDYDSFVKMLVKQHDRFSEEEEEDVPDLRDIFISSLSNVKNILLYTSRVAGLNDIDRVFIGSYAGVVYKLSDLAYEMLEIEAHNFNFYTDFHTKGEAYLDQTVLLALLEGQNQINGLPHNPYNVSIYKRPGKLLTRKGGKALFLVVATTIISLLFPLYYQVQIWGYEGKTKQALSEIGKSKAEFEASMALKEALTAQKNKLEERKIEVEQEYLNRKSELREIYKIRTKSKTVATNLLPVFESVVKSNLLIKSFSLNVQDLNMNIVSAEDTRITTLLNSLVGAGYYSELHEILQDEHGNFTADMKVRLK